jgi:2-succinyl-5-enolpyruvyl-6-hydroxy-3-cyclohexene-1-carboxylate synthase
LSQPIYDIAEICAQKGIDTVIISPGSRSAPLVLAFARHPKIAKHVVLDERSAAYMALGMAITSGKTVALVCTSGTAALNFAPAIAEAYYLNIPLLVLTADRPPEWIDQSDGQTIRQQNLYANHVKCSYQLPVDVSHPDSEWHINRTINEAINLAATSQKGPVHVNIPLREPLYPSQDTPSTYSKVRIIHRTNTYHKVLPTEWEQIKDEFNNSSKKLLVLGQQPYSQEFIKELKTFVESSGITLVADTVANAHFLKADFVRHHDLFLPLLGTKQLEKMKPDMVISVGGSLVSKPLKLFLRKHKPTIHWHVTETEKAPDTFRTLTRHLPVSPYAFLKKANRTSSGFECERNEVFSSVWLELERVTDLRLKEYQAQILHSDFSAVFNLMQNMPQNSILHVANSMAIRYVNFIGAPKYVEVHSNRGTSGIDGCLSTAVGAALKTHKTVTLLIGDLAFFYDSNAFFQETIPENLKIVVLNNRSGNIFKTIDGPSHLPESKRYFETPHQRSVQFLVEGYGLKYGQADENAPLKKMLQEIYAHTGCAVLEVQTDASQNLSVLKKISSYLRSST